MNYISLFSGIGGFDLALDRAGHHCLAQVEKDAKCRAVLARHWPAVPRFDDVITFGRKDVDGTIDIVCGGSPCQSFSVAGLRKSLGDERGNLAFEFIRVCDELWPRYVIWENVPGVLSTKDNAFGCFLAGLVGETAPIVPHGGRWTNAGVVAGPERTAAWRVLDAQYFGVAQRRRRVFVVASAGDFRCAEILFEREGVRRDTAPRREARESVAGYAPSSIGGYTEALTTLRGSGGDAGGGSEQVIVEGIDVRNSRSQGGVSGTLQAKKTGGYSLNYQNPVAIYQFASGGGDDLKDSAQALRAGAEHNYQVVYDARGNGSGDNVPNLTGDHANRITDYTPVVVQQNTRDEVRLVNGDGQIAGSLSAQAGMKQQNYVVDTIGVDSQLNANEDKIGPLRSFAKGGTVGQLVVQGFDRTRGTVSGDVAAPLRANGGRSEGVNDGKADNQCVVQQNAVGDPDVANSVDTKVRHDYDNQVGTAVVAFQLTGDRDNPSISTYDNIAPTVPANPMSDRTAAVMHNATVRRLTPVECERLQSFPDGWTAEQSDTPRYKQLGNAVCVSVVEWIARRI